MLCVQIDAALVTSTVRSTPQWMARELKLTRIIQQPRPTCAPLVLLWELLTKKKHGPSSAAGLQRRARDRAGSGGGQRVAGARGAAHASLQVAAAC